MASKELIIDEEYCKELGLYFIKQGEQMDKLVLEYISILQDVKNKAIIKGEVTKSLDIYITYVNKINNKIGDISYLIKMYIDSFLERIDSEDKYLF